MPLAVIDYTLVAVALITAIPATIAAVASYLNHRALKTPSATAIGRQVEDALQTSIANNYRLQAMAAEFDVPMPEKAAEVETKVSALNEIRTRAQREARPNG